MTSPDSNAVDWFVDRHTRDGDPTGVAFEDPWRSLTRGGLADATRRFAGALTRGGIGRERRLVMLMLDTVDFPIVFWGALRSGVIPVTDQYAADTRSRLLCPGRQPCRGYRHLCPVASELSADFARHRIVAENYRCQPRRFATKPH